MSLSKLFNRIFWSNNTTPAINEDNLNAMSKAIDDIDDRVIQLAGDVIEKAQSIIACSENPPYIGANGNWYVWNTDVNHYVDSEIDASITVSIADVTALEPDQSPYVTNTGTSTDPIFHLFIPRGQNGTPGTDGTDGVSPGVTISAITGGHRVTITDKDHPSGQSFDVMDGSGAGDMQKSVYDANSTVSTAGGIVAYVTNAISNLLSKYSSGSNDWDTAPTSASTKPVTSDGVYANTVRGVSSLTPTDDGTAKLRYNKGAYGYDIALGVAGWDKLVGKWTETVTKNSAATSCALANPFNSTNIDVEPFCENSNGTNIAITSMSITASTITLNFSSLSIQTKFKAKVTLNG